MGISKAVVTAAAVLLSLCFSPGAAAQEGSVRLPAGTMTVGQLIAEIEAQTQYLFVYSENTVNVNRQIKFNGSEVSVKDAVDGIVNDGRHTYSMRNRYVVISELAVPEPVRAEKPRVIFHEPPVKGIAVIEFSREKTGIGSDVPVIPDVAKADPVEEKETVVPLTVSIPPYIVVDAAPGRTGQTSTPEAREPGIRESDIQDTERITDPMPVYIEEYDYEIYISEPARKPAPSKLNVKTNFATLAVLAPNLGLEFGFGKRSSVELSGSLNMWSNTGAAKRLDHWMVHAGYRYWFREPFRGHFAGVHGMASGYDINGYKIPVFFDAESGYKGTAYGAGLDYGYQMRFGRRWGAEFNVGGGVVILDHDKTTGEQQAVSEKLTYMSLTKLGLKLVFYIM